MDGQIIASGLESLAKTIATIILILFCTSIFFMYKSCNKQSSFTKEEIVIDTTYMTDGHTIDTILIYKLK